MALVAWDARPLLSQETPAEAGTPEDVTPIPAEDVGESDILTLRPGRSRVLEFSSRVRMVSVNDPTIVIVHASAENRILLLAQAPGSTDVVLTLEDGEVWQRRVDVLDEELEALSLSIQNMFPDGRVTLSKMGEVILLDGTLARAEQIKELDLFLKATQEASPKKMYYVNNTRLAGVQQVQIQVRVAEVSRRAIRTLGFAVLGVGSDAFGGYQTGSAGGGAFNPISIGVPEGAPATPGLPFQFTRDADVSPLVSLFGGLPRADVAMFIQALAENDYVRILAEPNLVALSGEEATFLAGGEFPIPVVQGGTANSTSISIEYKEFGVFLKFRPTVLGDGRIRLVVAPEVSDITDTGAVEIQGFRIPAIFTRRTMTTLELNSGETFAMAGLLNHRHGQIKSKIPVLGDLPVLGTLFRSTRFESQETELVVIASATLVEPVTVDTDTAPVPGSIELPLEDWDIFLRKDVRGRVPDVPTRMEPGVLQAMKLGKLKGPGAWTTHEQGIARSRASKSAVVPASGPSGGAMNP
jgi:pilus assembly protein CpaC